MIGSTPLSDAIGQALNDKLAEMTLDSTPDWCDSRHVDELVVAVCDVLDSTPVDLVLHCPACGQVSNGHACPTLRAVGERLCPDCNPNGPFPAPIDRLRTAAATLNEALVTYAGDMPLVPATLAQAVTAWRRTWLQVDGRELPVGDVAQPPVPTRKAHSYERGRR